MAQPVRTLWEAIAVTVSWVLLAATAKLTLMTASPVRLPSCIHIFKLAYTNEAKLYILEMN